MPSGLMFRVDLKPLILKPSTHLGEAPAAGEAANATAEGAFTAVAEDAANGVAGVIVVGSISSSTSCREGLRGSKGRIL